MPLHVPNVHKPWKPQPPVALRFSPGKLYITDTSQDFKLPVRCRQVLHYSSILRKKSKNPRISWFLKMGQIICPETSVSNYHSALRNIPEWRRSEHKQCLISNLAKLYLTIDQLIENEENSHLVHSWCQPRCEPPPVKLNSRDNRLS